MIGIDLFAGAGGFAIGMECNGIEVVMSNDFSQYSKIAIKNNFDHRFICLPIEKIKKIPRVDIITAGFPCQPFSIAGNKKGMDDIRISGMKHMLTLIKKYPPKMLLFENVKNFLTMNNGEIFQWFREKIESYGYHIYYQVIDTAKYSVLPQHRERLFMICFRKENHFTFPDQCLTNYSRDIFLEKDIDQKYYYTKKSSIYPILKDMDDEHFYQYRRTFLREIKSGLCPTLTANMGSGGHNVPIIQVGHKIRKLTPRECFRLQGFPDEYSLENLSDTRAYHLAGNAVSVPIV